MKSDNYIVILFPMVDKLKLSGNSLLIFALIHGFSQDGNNEFTGSLTYLCKWFGLTKNSAMTALKKLVDAGFISKREYYNNGVKFCAYKSNYNKCIDNLDSGAKIDIPYQKVERGGAKIAMGGGAKIAPNNTTIYNTNNNIDIEVETEVSPTHSNSEIEFVEAEEIQHPVNTTSVAAINENVIPARAKKRAIEEREQDFYNSLIPYLAEYGAEMIREFYDYWSEPNQSKTKMKFELEKTWSAKRRLATWSKNQSKFDNNGFKTKQQEFDENLARLAEKCARDSHNAQFITREEELARLADIPM